MARILGIDPGRATGLAIYDTETLSFVHMEETGEGIYGFRPRFKDVFDRIFGDSYGVTHMVCENFTLRSSNKFTADLSGVEIIGWLKGERYWGGHNPEPSQHMILVKKPVLTRMMKEAGFKVGKGHTRMAGSVAVWYAAKVLNHRPTLALLKPKD